MLGLHAMQAYCTPFEQQGNTDMVQCQPSAGGQQAGSQCHQAHRYLAFSGSSLSGSLQRPLFCVPTLGPAVPGH